MTIKRIMIGLLTVLSALLLVSQGLLFKQSYQDSEQASQAVIANIVVSDLLKAAGQWAMERGVTNAALNDTNPTSPEITQKIAGLREANNAAFKHAMERITEAGLTIEDEYRKNIDAALEKLTTIRAAVDADIKKPKAERDPKILEDWAPTITSVIMQTQKLRVNLSSQALVGEAALGKDTLIRHSVWMMTEYAGRERAIIAGAIAADQPIAPEQLQKLAEFRGKVEEGWNILTGIHFNNEELAQFDAPIAAVRDDFFGSFNKVRQTAYSDAKLGVGYSMSGEEWIARSTQAIDTLLKLQDVSSAWTMALMEKNRASSHRQMAIYGFATVIALITVMGALWVILGRVVRPITAMSASMTVIAAGDYAQPVPYLNRSDEIGGMAQSVEVFRENGLEKIRLQKQQEETEKNAAIEKKRAMNALADGFESSVKAVVTEVSSSAEQMRGNAERLTTLADDTQQRSGIVSSAATEAAQTATQVSAAAEELTAAIGEISAQVQKSSSVASQAGSQAQSINQTMLLLVEKSNRVGEVIQFITNIASQINLLALNATIESARAGEAGRGFAVVASEVKNLATQTAKATEEIVQQVQSMQEATKQAVESVTQISSIINEISASTAGVAAAVEEQSAATNEISRNIGHTASGTTEISQNIGAVQQGAEETGLSSTQVLTAAQALTAQTILLNEKVNAFLATVRAA